MGFLKSAIDNNFDNKIFEFFHATLNYVKHSYTTLSNAKLLLFSVTVSNKMQRKASL